MKRERRCTRLDEARPDRETGAGAVEEPAPHLDGDRDVDRLRDRLDDPAREIRLFEERRPRTRLRDLAHGTAEVDVDDVGARRDDHPRRFAHRSRIRAEELDCERVLVGRHAQVAERALVPMLDARAADHLGAHETCPETASLAPERLHADTSHGGEDEPRRDLDGPDPPGFEEVDRHRGTWYGRGLLDC